METTLLIDTLHDDRNDLVSMNRLEHGWACQKLADQPAIFRDGNKDGYDWLHASLEAAADL